ncbi:MAG: hypothetical protein II295_04320 [Akkermansia sp.]|nr:hypothetical protein [Akkermansia sp.]
MLLIIGLGSILWNVGALHNGSSWGRELQAQMGHAAWEGLHAYDLIFPVFVYISGVCLNFSQRRQLSEERSNLRLAGKMWLRALILVVLGWLVNGPLVWELSSMRLASVLGLIGISGALGGTLAMLLRGNWRLAFATLAILLGVWAAQHWGGDYTPRGCANAQIDAQYCPGKLYGGSYDPEGPLCILSATALCLLGYLSGRVFSNALSAARRICIMLGGGIALLAVGLSVGPVIKNIWTPCFVLASAGVGAILLGVFHLVCDVLRWRAWSYPLRVVGCNALFIYMLTNLIDLSKLTSRVFGGTLQALLPADWLGIAYSSAYLLLAWLLCFFLYRRGVFIRV